MKHIYRKPWFRILPIVVLVIFLLVDILRLFTPSGGAAGTGFSTYHDSYYGYTINYPGTWKVMHNPIHTTEFATPGTSATCQVSVNITRAAMIPQKALLSVVPRGAYSIAHKTIDGSPAIAFSQYSSSVQGPDGKFTSASTKKVVVAQANTPQGANLYTLSLDMFRAAFVRSKNSEPHIGCESNFEVMANSLVLSKGLNRGLANVVSNDTINNLAIQYANTHWSWTNYQGTTDLFCTYEDGYPQVYPFNKCNTHNLYASNIPDDGHWYFQPHFQCAEFVSRALSKAGYINLNADTDTQGAYSNYEGYDLTNVGKTNHPGLYQFLLNKMGSPDLLTDPTLAQVGDVVFYYTDPTNADSREHVTIIVDKTADGHLYVAGHNIGQKYALYAPNGFPKFSILHLPPPPASNPGVTLFDTSLYIDHGNSINYQTSGNLYNLPAGVNDNTSSIYVAPGWAATVYQNSNGSGPKKTFTSSFADLRVVTFDNSPIIIDNQISSILVVNLSLVCTPFSSSMTKNAKRIISPSCGSPPPVDCPNTAAFITDVNYPDGAAVTPGQSFTKTWRLQNTSQSCTWSGFTLNFVSGVQLNGPASVSVPTTGPGQTVDISVPLVAPSNGGTYRGYWQLEDSQGVYVSNGGGGSVWVEIFVPYSSNNTNNGGTNSISASYPSVVTPGQHFQPQVTVTIASGQLLQSRGDMLRNVDGNLYGAWPFVAVVGTVNPNTPYTFTFYANNPIIAPSSEGTYSSVWQL